MKLEDIVSQNKIVSLNELTSDRALVKDIQTRLSALGLMQVTDIDGTYDPTTEAALKRFCVSVNLDNSVTKLFGPTFAKKLIGTRAPIVNLSTRPRATPAAPDALATALKFTLLWEGGFVDHINDIGGPTNFGVTQATYNTYRIKKKIPTQTVQNISSAEVQELYQVMYWQPSQAGSMVLPLAIVHFDTAVLFGVGGAILFLQEALNIPTDGGFGLRTKTAVEENNNKQTALKIIDGRVAYHQQRVKSNPSQAVFLDGWVARANSTTPSRLGLREFIKNF